MSFTANIIGQSLHFPCIPMEEVILSYAKAMVIPYGFVETLVGAGLLCKVRLPAWVRIPKAPFIFMLLYRSL